MIKLNSLQLMLALPLALGLGACGGGMAPSASVPVVASTAQGGGGDATAEEEARLSLQDGAVTTQSPSPPPEGDEEPAPVPLPLPGEVGGPAPVPELVPLPVPATAVMIPFASTRAGGEGGLDLYLFDRLQNTVLALPGVNTPADEFQPVLSPSGRYLIFTTNVNGNLDIETFDMVDQRVNTLSNLNTPADEFSPSIEDAGDRVAFISRANGKDELRIHELSTGQSFISLAANATFGLAGDPAISGDGRFVAYTTVDGLRGSDVLILDLATSTVTSPPFINTVADEGEPALSDDGSHLVYRSNVNGTADLYMADLVAGVTLRLALADSPADETAPTFFGPGFNQVQFQSNRDGDWRVYLLDGPTGLIDTLPFLHEPGEDDLVSHGSVGPGGGLGPFSGGPGRGGGSLAIFGPRGNGGFSIFH